MVKNILSYIICFVPLALNAQKNNVIIVKPSFKFAAVEKHVLQPTVTAFINQNKNAFPAYTDTITSAQTIEDLYAHLHFTDINNDGLDDVIFEGQDTAEGNIVKLFINNGKNYTQVFEDKQGITGMRFTSNKLATLQISDWGCCGAYLNFERTYNVSFNNSHIPSFKLVKQTAAVFDGAEPDSLFVKPFTAIITNYNTHLRSTPTVDDSSYTPWQVDSIPRGSGNTIGLLSKDISCMVIGKKAGNDNWWYVELDENTPVHRGVFYTAGNNFPAKRRGWVRNNTLLVP